MKNGLVVMRCQPLHEGHYSLITKAIEQNDIDKLYIGIGSANISGTIKNPMTALERENYIKQFFIHKEDITNLEKLSFIYIDDYYDEERWLDKLHEKIREHNINYLFYHAKKDGSSSWVENVCCKNIIDIEPVTDISATSIRQTIIDNPNLENHFYYFNPYRQYVKFINDYNSKFVHPYCNKTTHVTVDLLLKTDLGLDNAIVLIKRNKGLGSGKYALIGGFVEPNETCLDAVIRECYEETGISLLKSILTDEPPIIFDAPNRSDRGRIITLVYQYYLESYKLLKIIDNFKGNDEVSEIKIVSKEEFNSTIKYNMLDDHSLIISEIHTNL